MVIINKYKPKWLNHHFLCIEDILKLEFWVFEEYLFPTTC